MGSVFDDSKEVTKIGNLSDREKGTTAVVVPDYEEKKTSEIFSKTEEIVSEKREEETLTEKETTTEVVVYDDQKKTADTLSEREEIVSEKREEENVTEKEETNENLSEEKTDEISLKKKPTVVFVLGGPGGGKSTQCANLAKEIGYTHLSSGDLLRKSRKNDPENWPMIERMIKEGASVPPDVTMRILKKAMDESLNDKFLLDGFPRDEEIRIAFEAATNTEPELVLFFDCSEEERQRRILSRNQGRVDDNPESIRKRFDYFEKHTLPVVEYYNSKGKVSKIDATKPMEDVFEILKSLLSFSCMVPPEMGKHEDSCDLEKDILNMKI